jgi:hypothetical protein
MIGEMDWRCPDGKEIPGAKKKSKKEKDLT